MHTNLRVMVDFLAPVTNEEFEALAALFRPVPVKKMNHLYSQGDMVKDLYFLDKGLLRIYYIVDGTECTANFDFPPYIFTDIYSIREKVPTSMNMQALKDSECYAANFEAVEKLVEQYPNLLNVFFKLYENLFLMIKRRQLATLFDSPKQRYLNLFKERPNVIADIPQHYIASYLGIKPETLSRIRRKIF